MYKDQSFAKFFSLVAPDRDYSDMYQRIYNLRA